MNEPRLYNEFADWFHLLTAPEEYAEEAAFYMKELAVAIGQEPKTFLELGSGGGNNASHYKRHVTATLTDLSPAMLALSSRLNPDCEHIQGDMRTLRLGRTFDAVLVHDAVCYLTTLQDLHSAFETAFTHCRSGGAALFAPDHLRETFKPYVDHGGHDGPDRSLRYLEWVTDPDPSDSIYSVELAYILHERGKAARAEYDLHTCGLFTTQEWLDGLRAAGFDPVTKIRNLGDQSADYFAFIAVKPE